MALTQLLGGPEFDTLTNQDSARYADFHYFFNSGSVIRSNPWNSPSTPVAKIMNVTNITANNVALNYVNTSGSIVATTLSGSESRIITSQTLPLGLDFNTLVGLNDNTWLSASFISNYTGSIVARPTGSRWFELDAIRTVAQSTYLYTIPSGSTSITRTSLSSPISGSTKNYACSLTIPYVDQPYWLIRDLYDCSGGTTTTTTTSTTTTTTTTTSTTTTLSPNFIQYLVVAGGGGGGYSNDNVTQCAAGGGAGGWMTGSATITYSGTPISVIVGTGGAGATTGGGNSTNGGDSSFNDIVTTGGGRGGRLGTTAQSNGGNGGSGGGALYTYTPGTGISGEGFAGNAGVGNVSPYYGGSGGGAAGAASGRNPGNGKQWFDGNYYAAGGAGYNAFGPTGQGTKGSGGNGSYNANGQNGQDGIVIIRYQGIPRATGGTLTYTGGYTYHTFTASGYFTFNGITSTTTTTTTTAATTTTLASQKYYIESCLGPGDVVGVFTITNAPLLQNGAIIRIAGGGIAGYYCFTVYGTSTGTSLGTYSLSDVWQGAAGNCAVCSE